MIPHYSIECLKKKYSTLEAPISAPPKRFEQQRLYTKIEEELRNILHLYLEGNLANFVIIKKLLFLLEELEYFKKPYIFEDDIREEANKLDRTIRDYIIQLNREWSYSHMS